MGLIFLGSAGFLLTWTITVAGLAVWLEKRFRDIEKLIYRELHEHAKETREKIESLHTRVYRLEVQTFGITFADQGGPSNNAGLSVYQRPPDKSDPNVA